METVTGVIDYGASVTTSTVLEELIDLYRGNRAARVAAQGLDTDTGERRGSVAWMTGDATRDAGEALDIATLEALLSEVFKIGLDVGRGIENDELVRLRLSKALLGAAEVQALAAEALALEAGVSSADVADAEALALHAAAFNGMPDPVLHMTARSVGIVTGLTAIEPDPRAPSVDVVLDIAQHAATGLHHLLQFRRDLTTADTKLDRQVATARLQDAHTELATGVSAIDKLLHLAQ